MAEILIVEDHENIRHSLCDCLEREGHHVVTAKDLKSAREISGTKFDLILLDWMLPDGQGLDFLVELRRQKITIPVIFLTAKAELIDKVLGLEMGANDYMTKPFESRELLARVRVQLRDQANPKAPANHFAVGRLSIDRQKHLVIFDGRKIELVKKEFDLVSTLAENPERVFSRDELLNKVWGYDVFPTTRTVDTHVMLLRQKIHDELIETVRSVGYRLKVL